MGQFGGIFSPGESPKIEAFLFEALWLSQEIQHVHCVALPIAAQGWIFIFVERVAPQGQGFQAQRPGWVRRNTPNTAETYFFISIP